ncbi:MAG: hypothetical protein ACXW5U_15860 [Thermoanaerobaculia bacterium]
MKRASVLAAAVVVGTLGVSTVTAQEASGSKTDEPVYVYIIRNDRGVLNNPNFDAITQKHIIEPSLQLADKLDRHFTAKAICKKPPCSPEEIVDAYFDYYPTTFPTTSARIAGWVRENNPEAFKVGDADIGDTIDLPCLSVSPQQTRGYVEGNRITSPCGDVAVAGAFGWEPETLPALLWTSPEDPRRAVNETVERMTLEEYRIAYPAPPPESVAKIATARGDLTNAENRLMSVTFLSDVPSPDETDCRVTPYRAAWQQRLAALDVAAIKTISEKQGLVLIDWDFERGHGKKVKAVADRMLDCLGLPKLQPQVLDLHPRRNTVKLEQLVRKACKNSRTCDPSIENMFSNICERQSEPAQPFVTTEETLYLDALCWIGTRNPPDSLEQQIDQYVLRAAFEESLESGSWINVSFDMRRDEAESIHQTVDRRKDSRSMIFAAAGNKGAVDASLSPQGLARDRPARVVNVTFGKRDGTIEGAVSSMDEVKGLSEVAVLAPGSGFQHTDFAAGSAGSSFASPWVAAAAWVKRLVDKTGRESIRRELIRASRSVRADIFAKVTSGGFFDPYLLMAEDSRRMVTADESTFKPLVAGTMDYIYFDVDLNREQDGTIQICGQSNADYFIYEAGSKTYLWKRPRAGIPNVVELRSLRARIQYEGEAQPEEIPLPQFVQRYGEFTTFKVCQ